MGNRDSLLFFAMRAEFIYVQASFPMVETEGYFMLEF